MIRLLDNSDKENILKFLSKEKELNLFIIGDILNFGFDKPFQKVWAEFDQEDNIIAVLLKHHNNFIFYSRENYNCDAFCEIISKEKFKVFSGEKSIIENIKCRFKFLNENLNIFCKLDKNDYIPIKNDNVSLVKVMSKENIEYNILEEIALMYQSIDEFLNPASFEQLKADIESGSSRIFYIEEDGIIVSTARTGAENDGLAMVLSVATMEGYREKGYATACIAKLCSDLLKEGKTLCLFYDNPNAGRIYKKIGFKQIGFWVMLVK
ncbi:GNAT family N-acetyltransferase [Caldicellulosiruptoraceae bacterium PP1]